MLTKQGITVDSIHSTKIHKWWIRPVFLNRLATAQYRALASIISGR